MSRLLLLPLLALSLIVGCASRPDAGRASFSVEQDIPYVDGGHERQIGDLYRPAGPGPHPALLMIHGGGWIRGERKDMARFAEHFAAQGYVVFNVAYRFAPAHKHPAQLDDVRQALHFMHDRAGAWHIDRQRISAFGYSAGAHLALLLGLNPGDTPRLQAVVAGAGPTDLRVYPESPYIYKYIGGPPEQYPAAYADASPLLHASAEDPPVFLFHGRWDRLVEFAQSEKLQTRLEELDVRHQLYAIPMAGHITAFLFSDNAVTAAQAFLEASAPSPQLARSRRTP